MASAHGFTVQILDRTYDVEFTPPILRESERELGRPLMSTIRDERGWRGFTYDEVEVLLWVQCRRQNKRLTRLKLQEQLDRHLSEHRGTVQEWSLRLLEAFNACDLVYRVPERDDEEAQAEADDRPSLVLVRDVPVPVAGTSLSPEASTSG